MTGRPRDVLAVAAERAPSALALRTPSRDWTNAELSGEVTSVAAEMAAAVAPGAIVATLLEDDAPAVMLIHAARQLGIILVPLNRRNAPGELAPQLLCTRPGLLIHDGAHATLARTTLETAYGREPDARRVAGAPRRLDISSLSAPARVRPGPVMPLAGPDPQHPACIVFTSGTTGRPRGAVLSHGNLAASADAWAAVLLPRAGDRWLACLPLFHVAGLAVVMRASRWGVPLQMLDRFEASAVSDAIDDGVSQISLVPTQLQHLLRERSAGPPPTLRAILLGGGSVPPALLHGARSAGYPVLTTFGMTETASGVAVGGADPGTLEDATALRALPGVELAVAPGSLGTGGAEGGSAGGGQSAGAGGEILVRGGMVFGGYLGSDGVVDAGKVDADGWLHTGDLGFIDVGGSLHVTGRIDDLIISGGENVQPAEVEAVLLEVPGIADAAVVGRPDDRWGSVPVAAIVVEPDSGLDDALLVRRCRERLAGYKVPVAFHRLPALPRNDAGKLLRRRLLELLPEETR